MPSQDLMAQRAAADVLSQGYPLHARALHWHVCIGGASHVHVAPTPWHLCFGSLLLLLLNQFTYEISVVPVPGISYDKFI